MPRINGLKPARGMYSSGPVRLKADHFARSFPALKASAKVFPRPKQRLWLTLG